MEAKSKPTPGDNQDFCPKCGLLMSGPGRVGSITTFLFQDVRCKCQADKNFGPGFMAARLLKLKQSEMGSTFSDERVAESEATVAAPQSGTVAQKKMPAPESPQRVQRKQEQASKSVGIGLAKGAIIGGAYRIVALIGKGGMGEVYLSEHRMLDKKCALKVIPPEQVTEIGWLRFQAEARAVAKLDHINIVKVLDLGIHEGCLPFYAMEYVSGKTMAALLNAHGPMPLNTALDIFDQICDGLDCSHRNGIIHRDLKPANIMLSRASDGKISVKILDFGLAKLAQHDRHRQSLTALGEIMGSPFYMSPEQCEGDKIDRRSDIYSLGCNLFECLTGRPPFDRDLSAAIIRAHLMEEAPSLESATGRGIFPESMEVILAKLLRKNPVERYQSMAEVRGDLARVGRGEKVQPFYMNRGVPAGGDRITEKTSKGELEAPNSVLEKLQSFRFPSWGPRRLAIMVSILCMFLAGTALLRVKSTLWRSNLVNPLTVKPSVVTKPTVELAPPSTDLAKVASPEFSKSQPRSLFDKTPFTKVISKNGQEMRQYDFPTDVILGKIGIDDQIYSDAKGRLFYPKDRYVEFIPSPTLATYPTYIHRFRKGDIDLLSIVNPRDNYLLRDFTSVPGIRQLHLMSTVPCLAGNGKYVDKFESLKDLIVDENSIGASEVAKLAVLRQLRTLDLLDYGTIDEILNKVKGSLNLTMFCTNAKLSRTDLAKISTLPRVYYLQFNFDSALTVEDVRVLSKLPSLTSLVIYNWPVSPNSIEILKSLKWLKTLRLPGKRLTIQGANYMRTHLPNVEIGFR
jgi:serine/threonine protein kinase